MEDFGDIIYIVAIVVAIGLSIVKSVKKSLSETSAQPQSKPTETPEDWRQPLSDLVTESFPEVEYVFTDSKAEPKPEKIEEKPTATVESEQPKKVVRKHVVTETQEEETENLVPDFSDVDDVKRAIIAGEILNRKY